MKHTNQLIAVLKGRLTAAGALSKPDVEHNRLEGEEVYHQPCELPGGTERDLLDAGVPRELENRLRASPSLRVDSF